MGLDNTGRIPRVVVPQGRDIDHVRILGMNHLLASVDLYTP